MEQERQTKTAVILLVDDDRGDQELTRRSLRAANFPSDLRTVEDGQEALDYLRRVGPYASPSSSPRPDLILLDLNLPKLDGMGVLEAIRSDSDPQIQRLPVVILTTSQLEAEVQRSYRLGANSFITKRSSAREFTTMLRTLSEYWFQVASLPSTNGT